MKKLIACLTVCALLFCGVACAKAPVATEPSVTTSAPEAASTAALPEETAVPTNTPEPTAEPTPTPVPAKGISLSGASLSRRENITFLGDTLSFAPNSVLKTALRVQNDSQSNIRLELNALVVNNWMVDAVLSAPDSIAVGEEGAIEISVSGMDTARFSAMLIDEVVTVDYTFTIYNADNGKLISTQQFVLENPEVDSSYVDAFSIGEVLLDNNNIKVAFQSSDAAMRTVTLYVEKGSRPFWTVCWFAPICNGYTTYINPSISMNKGSRMLVELDNDELFTQHGIESLASMDVYITMQSPSKLDNSIQLTLTNPDAGVQTVATDVASDRPIIFQDQYSILRYQGIDQTIFADHPVILVDLENITQTYIKTMEIIAYPANSTIQLDGVTYDLESYCTYSYPYTHGWLMLWPVDAPDGALENASSASVKLKLSRFRSGHYDPVTDTGWLEIKLK